MDFLLFQLYGPLAAWGDVAVGEQRPTATHPSKSAIVGLLAAAKGIRRDQEDIHKSMASGYAVGVRVDASGELLRDYHTAQVPPAKGKAKYYTRRDELRSDDLYTILSARDYRMEGCYTVAIWVNDSSAPFSLEALVEALKYPKFVPYIGRKSCPLALPLAPQLVGASTLKAAFDQVERPGKGFLADLSLADQMAYYWEGLDNAAAGMMPTMVYPRRDQPLSRARWQFREREEFYFAESRKGNGV